MDRNKHLVSNIDIEIIGIRLEIDALQTKLSELLFEIADLEKKIHDFTVSYFNELGTLIEAILLEKKKKLEQEKLINPEKEKEFNEAYSDYESFKSSKEDTQNETVIQLSPALQEKLKNLYRKACKLCHPDKVPEKFTSKAREIFMQLDAAYKRNNINEVQKIYTELQNGVFDIEVNLVINDKELLVKERDQILIKINEAKVKIQNLIVNDSLKILASYPDLSIYFKEKRSALSAIKGSSKMTNQISHTLSNTNSPLVPIVTKDIVGKINTAFSLTNKILAKQLKSTKNDGNNVITFADYEVYGGKAFEVLLEKLVKQGLTIVNAEINI